MKKRIITGSILILILTPIFILEPLMPLFLVVMFLFAGMASYEIMTLKKEEHTPIFITVIVIILTLITTAAASLWMSKGLVNDKYSDFFNKVKEYDFFPVLAVAPFVIMGLFITTPKFKIELLARAIISIMYVGLAFASLITIRLMDVSIIVYLFLITILTDTFAYIFGSKFGKTQMSKNISPKKTWEGAIAGTVIATILAGLFGLFLGPASASSNYNSILSIFSSLGTKEKYIQALVMIPLTFFSSIIAQIGDLVGSKLKRSYDIKDFGTIFPGHGGVMDRFDSALFVSMFLVIVFMLISFAFPLSEVIIF
ncbi:MAG: phosphatidate cytidylyltransferase [Acholeplasmataceae bacterium]|jgi:phosphatidate cytidylyltransferase|nr:phosphatidate cytidylyltransferase [Acholeplasmataceae bacterium]